MLRPSIVAVVASTCGMVPVFATSALAPMLTRDTDLTPARLGIVVAVFFGTGAIIAPVAGRLADRLGSVSVIRMALLLATLSALAAGVIIHNWYGLAIALAVAGVANGMIQPSANRYISRLIPFERQGFAFGIKQAAIPAAILLGGLTVPLAAKLTGWRPVYVCAAAAAVVVAVIIRRPSPQRFPTPEAADTPALRPGTLFVLTAGLAVGSAGANALGSFFILAGVHAGFSTTTAGLLAAIGALASIMVRIGSGLVADRGKRDAFGLITSMAILGSFGLAALSTESQWGFLLALVLGYGIGWGWAGLFNYAVVRTDPARPGRTSGAIQTGAGIGACIGPLTFGALVTHLNYPIAWLAAATSLFAAAGLILAGRLMLTHQTREQAPT